MLIQGTSRLQASISPGERSLSLNRKVVSAELNTLRVVEVLRGPLFSSNLVTSVR
jgi:hypothetical protein